MDGVPEQRGEKPWADRLNIHQGLEYGKPAPVGPSGMSLKGPPTGRPPPHGDAPTWQTC
jgi:hypothetical protein